MTQWNRVALIAAAVLGAAFPFSAPAQTAPPPGRPAAARAPVPAPAPMEPADGSEKLLSLKFSDAPLELVLDRYAELTGRTILLAPGIKANITLRIEKRVTVPEAISAIEAVLAMNNIALVNEGALFVKVVQINTARAEGGAIRAGGTEGGAGDANYLMTEIIPLKHIELADAQAAIASVVHPYANVQTLPRINSLFVTDTAANLDRVKQLLGLIDQPIEMKEELHIIRVLHAKASDIKSRLDEIIAESQQQQKTPTATVRPALTGPPGVIRAAAARAAATRAVATPAQPDIPESSRDLIQGQVKLVADDRANILILITRPENMEFFNKIVQAIDIGVEPDVSVKVLRLEYADATEVEAMLNKLIGAGDKNAAPAANLPRTAETGERSAELSDYVRQMRETRTADQPAKSNVGELNAQNVKILSDKRSNAIIIMASKADMAAIEDVIRDMDIMLSQVLIETVILSISLNKSSETGFDWLQRSMTAYREKAGGAARTPLFAFTGGTTLGGGTPINALSTPSSFPGSLSYYMTFFDLNLDMVVKLSASDSRVRIVSSPVILTTDNKKAEIDISTDIYFYKGQKPISAGDNIEYVSDVESKAVGTTLTVTPRINKNKFVVMEIEQKIEDVSGEQSIPDQGTWPIVSRRKMSASIAVTSGDTIMLGGLNKKEERNTRNKIPILGDIPILGIPFRNDDRENKREEVIVFITPYVLDTPQEIENDAIRRREASDVAGLWKRGWSASKLAEPSDEEVRLRKIRDRLARRTPAAPPAPPAEGSEKSGN